MASVLLSSLRSMYGKLQDAVRGSGDDPNKIKSIEEDLKWLSRTLPRIVAIQQDAEEREIRDRSVELWLRELRGVVHEAEDVLDDYHYEVLKSMVENRSVTTEAESSHIGSKRKIEEMSAPSSLASSSSNVAKILIPDGMADKVKRIRERFEEISRDRENLHLREGDGERRIFSPQKRPPTSSHIDERGLFGRENEKEEIISLITPENGPDFMVLPIVGKGGLGKTTLAQLIYNDPKIDQLFDKKAWVSVSEDFDLVRLTKAIIESVTDNPCGFSELSKLQNVLKENLASIRLFLVLDDIWNEKNSLWDSLRISFNSAKFLRILITTRTYSVAKIMETVPSFELNNLPEEKCRMIFKHYAFGNQDESEHTNLHRIGDNIVKKCNGLPLVVKVLGSLLRYEMNEERWKEVLGSETLEIDGREEIMPVLGLSYQHLPLHLRPCFIYLSVFPKDSRLDKEIVIRLWMAQGYINNPSRYKTLEERGSEYFEELRSRSLIDECSYGSNDYVLHDLIHDLASSISERMCPAIKNDEILDSSYPVYHFYFDNEIKLPSNYKAIRTLLSFGYQTDFSIILKMAWLRVLRLRLNTYVTKLPDDVGILKHLRYLKIFGSALKSLPNSICLLYNLQTMDLADCENLVELPRDIGNLFNLRCLILLKSALKSLPNSICLLYNLQTMDLACCLNLVELPRDVGNLINLRCLILKGCNIHKLPESICFLCNLQILDLNYCEELKELPSGTGQLTSLRELKLCSNKLTSLPNSICLLYNLQTMDLADCENLVELPRDIGNLFNLRCLILLKSALKSLPNSICLLYNLQTMDLAYCHNLVELPRDVGNLINLRCLILKGCNNVHKLPESICFLCNLQILDLSFCEMLKELPRGIGQLTSLRELKLTCCTVDMPSGFGMLTNLKTVRGTINVKGGLGELKGLINLEGHLVIKNLRNINDLECKEMDLKSKSNLECLELDFSGYNYAFPYFGWSEYFKINCPNITGDFTKIEESVLDNLQPHHNIKKVAICGYEGSKFPSWIVNPLTVQNLTHLYLEDCCSECNFLPPLGQLPSLKILKIIHSNVEKIGEEFCRDGSSCIAFPALEKLVFKDMPKLKEWMGVHDGDFPCIKKLQICYCPNLSMLLTIPNELEVLKIFDCGFHGIQFPSPCKMKQMDITECENLTSIIGLHDPKFLTGLILYSCPLLKMPVDGLLQSITAEICIFECPSLNSNIATFNNIFLYLGNATVMKSRQISSHDVTFPKSSFALVCTNKVSMNSFHARVACEQCMVLDVPMLENLEISSMRVLDRYNFDNLKHLYILGCSKLCQWEDECMPEHIEFLEISCCNELSTIPPLDYNSALREIRIWNCPKLNAIQGLHCLISLRTLFLEDCQKLRVLPSVKLQTSLQTVQVHNCPWMIDWCILNDIPNYKWRHSFRREGISSMIDSEDDAERNSDIFCEDDSEDDSEEYSEDDRFFCKKGKEKISQ